MRESDRHTNDTTGSSLEVSPVDLACCEWVVRGLTAVAVVWWWEWGATGCRASHSLDQWHHSGQKTELRSQPSMCAGRIKLLKTVAATVWACQRFTSVSRCFGHCHRSPALGGLIASWHAWHCLAGAVQYMSVLCAIAGGLWHGGPQFTVWCSIISSQQSLSGTARWSSVREPRLKLAMQLLQAASGLQLW